MNSDLLSLYFIMGSQDAKPNDALSILESALQKGITLFQFREKGSNALKGKAYFDFANECKILCHQYNIPIIINDDVELALKIKADGIHIGSDDMPLYKIKTLDLKSQWIGYSVHSIDDFNHAIQNQVDYVGVGPIYPTQSKADAKEPLGVDFLYKLRQKNQYITIVAIGGINRLNYKEVLATGIEGIAVISAICQDSQFISDFYEFYGNFKSRQ